MENYKKCQNCGRYILPPESIESHFCSHSCAVEYNRCPTCGGFFQSEKKEEIYCSRECNTIYTFTQEKE